MDVPSPVAGVVKELKVKVGRQGQRRHRDFAAGSRGADCSAASGESPLLQPRCRKQATGEEPQPSSPSGIHAEVVVLGAGPGGYTAAFRAADLGKQVVLIEKHATLGGVCLNVGCIPSKALLHVAKVITEADEVSHHGVTFGKPKIDLEKIRAWKQSVVDKLTGGLAGLAKQRKVQSDAWRGKIHFPPQPCRDDRRRREDRHLRSCHRRGWLQRRAHSWLPL